MIGMLQRLETRRERKNVSKEIKKVAPGPPVGVSMERDAFIPSIFNPQTNLRRSIQTDTSVLLQLSGPNCKSICRLNTDIYVTNTI